MSISWSNTAYGDALEDKEPGPAAEDPSAASSGDPAAPFTIADLKKLVESLEKTALVIKNKTEKEVPVRFKWNCSNTGGADGSTRR